jgi:hypothetical protein
MPTDRSRHDGVCRPPTAVAIQNFLEFSPVLGRGSVSAFCANQGLWTPEPESVGLAKITRCSRAVGDSKPGRGDRRSGVDPKFLKLFGKAPGSFAVTPRSSIRENFGRSGKTAVRLGPRSDAVADFQNFVKGSAKAGRASLPYDANYEYFGKPVKSLLQAFYNLMANSALDANVHKAVEHSQPLITDGVNPPYVDQKKGYRIKTFLVTYQSKLCPRDFTRDSLPAGISFLGRPMTTGVQMIQVRLRLRTGDAPSQTAVPVVHAVTRTRSASGACPAYRGEHIHRCEIMIDYSFFALLVGSCANRRWR